MKRFRLLLLGLALTGAALYLTRHYAMNEPLFQVGVAVAPFGGLILGRGVGTALLPARIHASQDRTARDERYVAIRGRAAMINWWIMLAVLWILWLVCVYLDNLTAQYIILAALGAHVLSFGLSWLFWHRKM